MADFNSITFALACGLAVMCVIGFVTWVASYIKTDVSIVDSAWSPLIFSGAAAYAAVLPVRGPRPVLVLSLAALWALRLAAHITWRNWGEPEDHRYQAIRERNQPNFKWKSLYLVFFLQAVLAWIVSLSLLAGVAGGSRIGWLDFAGAGVVLLGIVFEAVADLQLARFKTNPSNRVNVMDSGLWRYTRHPNYFGEFCVWWGFYLIALAARGWWTIVSPLLMSTLLLKVSGVTLLEKDIGKRRPGYRDYVARTSAFFPRAPRGNA
jgi:steroid 5-alpha reductase family enzyme